LASTSPATGIGKALVPLMVRREAAKKMPINVATLKRRLEKLPDSGLFTHPRPKVAARVGLARCAGDRPGAGAGDFGSHRSVAVAGSCCG
jgi:hypothetical protein